MRLRGIELAGDWDPEEIREVVKVLAPLPPGMVEDNPHMTRIVRRAVLQGGPPEAPGHSKYEPSYGTIVVYDKGVYDGDKLDPEQFRRSIYHELAHSVLRHNPGLLDSWTSETKGDGYIDDYAETSPEEDFCDSFSEFLIQRNQTEKKVPRKSRFLAMLLNGSQQEKTAMSMIEGFNDELIKTAKGGMRAMLSKLVPQEVGTGKALLGMGAVGGGAALAGRAAGRSSGMEEGEAAGRAKGRKGARHAYIHGHRRGQADLLNRLRMMQRQRAYGRMQERASTAGKKKK